MSVYEIELLCTFYTNDGEPVERITFKMAESGSYECMEKCDHMLYKWAKDKQLNYDDYYFGYKIISKERKRND